jgi:hypothetical protein
MIPEMDGHDRFSFGLAMMTAIMWQPYVGHEAIGNLDWLGALYMPLIRLDRKFVHPTLYISSDENGGKLSNLKAAQVHPYWRDEWVTKISGTATRDDTANVIRCVFHYAGSTHPREISDIKMRKDLAKTLGASAPNGFSEEPFVKYDTYDIASSIQWVGHFTLSSNQDMVLLIPAKNPKNGSGDIVVHYQRTDNTSRNYRNICVLKLN